MLARNNNPCDRLRPVHRRQHDVVGHFLERELRELSPERGGESGQEPLRGSQRGLLALADLA